MQKARRHAVSQREVSVKMNHLERQSPFYASGQAGGSVASRSGSGSGTHSHASGTTSISGHPLPAVTIAASQAHNSHHHHRIHHQHLYAPPSGDHYGHLREHGTVAGGSGEGAPYYHHPVAEAEDEDEDALVTGGGSGGGGDYSECSYPPAEQQQHHHQQNEYGSNSDYHQRQCYSRPQVEGHEAGAEFDGQQRQQVTAHSYSDIDRVNRNDTHGGNMMMYQEPAAEGGDTPPTNDAVVIPSSHDAVVEKIVAAAADVHQAVQYALQLGEEKADVDDEEFHPGMGSNEDDAAMLADEADERRRRRKRMRRGNQAGRDAWSTIGGGRDDGGGEVGEVDDALGGDGSTWTTYDRRRAARRVLRGLVVLEETIEALSASSSSSSSMLAASMIHDNDSMNLVGDVGNDINANGNDNDNYGLVDDGEARSGDTNASLLASPIGRGEEKTTQDIEKPEKGFDDHEPSEKNGPATLTSTLEELMVDLLMIPTEVRSSLLANMRAVGDSGEENEDCVGSHEGGRSSNVGRNGIVQLLDESDTIASRIVVQYLNKSTDQYRLLVSLVPAQQLPPWNKVDGLLGRVFPQFVAVNGGKSYPSYRRTTAAMLGVINTIGSVYAAQGLSIEIPAIDAFVLCHYLARRGLSDLTTTNTPPAVLDGGGCGGGTDAVHEDAALQLRKLIVRVLGRLLECLAGARAGMGTSAFASKGLLHSLVAESQRLLESGVNSGTIVSTNDVEDCMDVLSEYCTEVMEYALDSLDSFNALVKSAMSDDAKGGNEGVARQILLLHGQSKIRDIRVESLRESIRSVQIAVKTFSTLHLLGIHPEPSTLNSFVGNLSDFWAISCNKLMRLARKPLGDGGMTHHLAEDVQQTIDVLGQQLIHISTLTGPRKSDITGRQRGGNKCSKRSSISKDEKSARFVAIVNAMSQSQRGGGCDDLCALLHGFPKKIIGPDTSQCRIKSGLLKFADIPRRNTFNRDSKRRKTKVSFEDDTSMDKSVPGRSYCSHDKNSMHVIEGKENEGMDKEESMFLLKKTHEEGAADMKLVNACLLSSMLLPEFPSLATQGNSASDEGNYRPNASFEESYKTAAALATGMSIQSGSDDDIRSLVCDPRNPWHELIGRRITDTVSKRDASGIGQDGGTDDVDSTLTNVRGALLRHAGACRSGTS